MKKKSLILSSLFLSTALFIPSCQKQNSTVDSITASLLDSTKTYKVNDSISKSDFKVVATYSDNSKKEVSNWTCKIFESSDTYTFKDADIPSKQFDIYYGDKSTSVIVPVSKGDTFKVTVLGGSGSSEVSKGSEVTIKAYDESNDPFINWTIDGEEVSKDKEYKLKVDKDITITANYEFGQYCKTIYKDTNKDFKILNLTDIQLHDGESTKITFDVLKQLVAKEEPDMITFLGDLLNDNDTYASITNPKAVIDEIDSLNIPWAPILGNHDFEDYNTGYVSKKTTTSTELTNWYKASKNCLYTDGPKMEDSKAKSNYVVNVIDSTTLKPVESLIFTDSRLAGLQDDIVPFYEKALLHTSMYNDKTEVPSVVFTHVAIPQYGDAITESKKIEYRDIVGSVNRDPCDLASGTKLLFPAIKKHNSTDLVICGHDHENAYYNTYDGVRLAYCKKSSEGDNYKNPDIRFPLGGSIVKLSNGKNEEFYYTDANVDYELTSTIKSMSYHIDSVGRWKYSGAKLKFEIESTATGNVKLTLYGTNLLRDVKEKERLGQWNRLNNYINFTGSDTSLTVDKGDLKKMENTTNRYEYTLDLANVDLNTGSGEVAIGDETLRLMRLENCTGNYKISNVHFEYENITETNQVDLKDAVISDIKKQSISKRTKEGETGYIPVKPTATVTLGGKELNPVEDILLVYENNDNLGTGKVKAIPSGKGAHKYKGESSFKEFQIEDAPRGKRISDGVITVDLPNYEKTKTLVLDFKFDEEQTISTAEKFRFKIGIQLASGEKPGKWDNCYGWFFVFKNGTFSPSNEPGVSVKTIEGGYIRVTIDPSQLTSVSDGNPQGEGTVSLIRAEPGGDPSKANGYVDINPEN